MFVCSFDCLVICLEVLYIVIVCSYDCLVICLEVLYIVIVCSFDCLGQLFGSPTSCLSVHWIVKLFVWKSYIVFVCVRKDRKTVKVCFADRNDNTQTSKVMEGCHYSIPQLLFVCYENIVLLICLSEVG